MNDPIEENVLAFLDDAAERFGAYKAEEFREFLLCSFDEVISPIERLFLVGLHLVSEVNFTDIATGKDFNDASPRTRDSLIVVPQFRVSTYAVDFALRHRSVERIVCVELDGHDFHDRDERQRRYEKKRDRFIAAKGHSLLHFTGAEVTADPCAVALEAFSLALGYDHASHPKDV